jgi:hypothetical protein
MRAMRQVPEKSRASAEGAALVVAGSGLPGLPPGTGPGPLPLRVISSVVGFPNCAKLGTLTSKARIAAVAAVGNSVG